MQFNPQSPKELAASIEAAGFRRAQRGRGYRLGGLRVTSDHAWLTVERKADAAGLLRGRLGKPGLWKTVVEPKRNRIRSEFHLPLAVLAGGDFWVGNGEEPANPLSTCLTWAAATAKGELPADWKSPPRELVESWIPSGGLLIQSGPFLEQGSLLCAPDRLGLRFRIGKGIPESASDARRAWIEEVLAAAENRWRMVRVGLDGAKNTPSITAEIDFSGAPHVVLEGLFKAGLDAIQCVVSWSLWPLAFLCDTRVACRAWEAPRAGIARRKEMNLDECS